MWGMEQMPAALAPKTKTCYYWRLLRFARLGASALRTEASARGAMTTACTTAEEKNILRTEKGQTHSPPRRAVMWGMEQMPAAHRPKNKKTCY